MGGLQQNSLKSIQQAATLGYKMAEFDVRLTHDEVVVLFHDHNYKTRTVEQFDYHDFIEATKMEYPDVSTLEDVLSWLSESNRQNKTFDFKLNIEIKSKKIFNGRLEKKVNDLIKKYEVSEKVLISSFNPFSLYRFKKMQPHIFRALLLTRDEDSNFLLNHMVLNFLCTPDALHLRWNDFSETEFAKIQEKVPIVLWTVNDIEKIEAFKSKIFGVISDCITPEKFQ